MTMNNPPTGQFDANAFEPERAVRFLTSLPEYQPTPLIELAHGHGFNAFCKVETERFGMGAFKALGGIYAVAWLLGISEPDSGNKESNSANANASAQNVTFICASAGNHGLGVARSAQMFGASCKIFLPLTAPNSFEAALHSFGAQVHWVNGSYEDAMAAANAAAAGSAESIYLPDSSADGEARNAALIMEGYMVMADEIADECRKRSEWPSHVFLQAGVGGFAGAITWRIRESWPLQPEIIIVEPENAACLAASHRAGQCVSVAGPQSNMHRLYCREPSPIAFDALEKAGVSYVAVSDSEAERAVADLGKFDIATSPSGAAGFAALTRIGSSLRKSTQGGAFRPLFVITEGDGHL